MATYTFLSMIQRVVNTFFGVQAVEIMRNNILCLNERVPNGNLIATIAGYVTNGGAAALYGNSQGITSVNRSSQGVVTVTYDSAVTDARDMIISATFRDSATGQIVVDQTATTYCTVRTYDSADSLQDKNFMIVGFNVARL